MKVETVLWLLLAAIIFFSFFDLIVSGLEKVFVILLYLVAIASMFWVLIEVIRFLRPALPGVNSSFQAACAEMQTMYTNIATTE
jgi:phosphoglycerol transferase MdoB-like AlkP superfamily enzyme